MKKNHLNNLPEGVLIGWYGDDFTGSAAVMEVLSFAGLPSVLFLDVPTADQLANFPGVRGIGIAGTARSQTPPWMQENLPSIFQYLNALNAPITHYKICSTLDSSPEVGSIGLAIDLAQEIFQSPWIPLYLAAPAIRRYQSFGHLFAGASDGVYRLDRHPVMSQHPVTPMSESDVARHISLQTDKVIEFLDLEGLASDQALSPSLTANAVITSIDTVSDADLIKVGKLIWENRGEGILTVGSQGIEYALVAHWLTTGDLATEKDPQGVSEADNIIVVSGSVSSVTAGQIDWALDNGFAAIKVDANALLNGEQSAAKEVGRVVEIAISALNEGRDPLIFSAKGPDDPSVQEFIQATAQAGLSSDVANNLVGKNLGLILETLLRRSDVCRAVISGGDTSGHATQQLGIYALTALAPTVPGAALFQAHSDNPQLENLQLALKGGQMGTVDYFGWVKSGGGAARTRGNGK